MIRRMARSYEGPDVMYMRPARRVSRSESSHRYIIYDYRYIYVCVLHIMTNSTFGHAEAAVQMNLKSPYTYIQI